MAGRPHASEQRKAATQWAAWVRHGLTRRGWQQADLIRAAGNGPDGRPILSSSRVSQWVNGKEAASPDYAVIVARAFGVPDAEALNAIVVIEGSEGEAETGHSERDATASRESDAELIARLRSSSDPEMHKLADLFEQDLERVRRMARMELEALERRQGAEKPDRADDNPGVNKSA